MIHSQALCAPPDELASAGATARLTAEALQERYLDDVFRYVTRRLARREEAEDVTAEVFAAAFAALPRFRGDCPPRLWLLGIARRKVADVLRRRKTRPETLACEMAASEEALCRALTTDGPEVALQRAERWRIVRELLAGLKEEQREALLLRYVEGLDTAEVALVLGRSPAAANSLLQRARASLFRRGRDFFLNEGGER